MTDENMPDVHPIDSPSLIHCPHCGHTLCTVSRDAFEVTAPSGKWLQQGDLIHDFSRRLNYTQLSPNGFVAMYWEGTCPSCTNTYWAVDVTMSGLSAVSQNLATDAVISAFEAADQNPNTVNVNYIVQPQWIDAVVPDEWVMTTMLTSTYGPIFTHLFGPWRLPAVRPCSPQVENSAIPRHHAKTVVLHAWNDMRAVQYAMKEAA